MRENHNRFRISFQEYVRMRTKAEQLLLLHGAKSCASGSIVGRNLVLTANHAVTKHESAKIFYKDIVLDAAILKRMPEIDVMILKINDSALVGELPSLQFGFSEAVLGERVYSVGYPLPFVINCSPLFYSHDVTRLKVDIKPHFLQIQSQISSGCSGMVVVNDRLEIVGVVTSKAGDIRSVTLPSDWGFATKSQYFKNSIQKYLSPTHRRSKAQPPQVIAQVMQDTSVMVLACENKTKLDKY